MDGLLQRIRIARHRLNLERFLSHLFRSLCAWFVVALLAIMASKIWAVGVDADTWTYAWLGSAFVAGVITAAIVTWLTRKSELEAAIEIDRRFGLKERVSSALALDAELRESPVGQALVEDAVKCIERLDVGERFQLRLDRSAWWPLVPGSLAVLIAFLVSSRVPENPVAANTTTKPVDVKQTAQALQRKIAQQQQKARDKKELSAETEAVLKKLEQGTKELGNQASPDKKKSLVKLNDLSKDLERRMKALGMDEKFKQQLNNLKDLKKGPADAAAQALKKGDFRKAMKDLQELKEKLAGGKLNEQEKKELAEQLNQMKEAMQKAAEAHEQAKKQLAEQLEQLEQARKAGDTQQAEKLQQQIDKLAQQQPAMEKLEQLAQECKNCANAMKNGNAQQAQQALEKLAQQVEAMAQAQDEMKMLEEALDQIGEAKQMIAGGKNQMGEMGEGMEFDEFAAPPNFQRGGTKPGRGSAPMRDQNDPEIKTGHYDSAVKQNVGKGAGTVTDLVHGPNRKGEVTEEVKQSFEDAKQSGDDPLTGERLPRDYRDHAKEYFDAFRKGQ